MNTAFVVLNPVAGNSDAEMLRDAVKERFASAGWDCIVHKTMGEESIKDLVLRARCLERGCDLVVAAGGDGTVSGVADGLAQGETPLGIIPVGTGNMLARCLGIPLHVDEALDLLLGTHQVRAVDALRVGTSFFLLNIGVGASARIMQQTDPVAKRRFGLVAYLWTGAAILLGTRKGRVRFELDGSGQEQWARELLIANCMPAGLTLGNGRLADPGDGRVEVLALPSRSLASAVRLLWNMLLGKAQSERGDRWFDASREIRVEGSRPFPVQGDGECFSETPLRVRIVPGALRVIVPSG